MSPSDAGTPDDEAAFDEAAFDSAAGEPGHAGHKPSADPAAGQPTGPITPRGTVWDATKSAANAAALGAGPVIAGGMGALANAATQGFHDKPTSDLAAYRSVRDDTAKDLASAENTELGQAAAVPGMLATPLPFKALPKGAGFGAHAIQAGKVGGTLGTIHGAATSKGDATKMDMDEWGRLLGDALKGGAAGAAGGAAMSPVVRGLNRNVSEPALNSVAETQALRAAGLRGGIKNSIKKDLGLSNMDEARELGRKFLDEGLIPPIGSSEAVAGRAEKLANMAGNAKSSVLSEGDVVAGNFDFAKGAKAARDRLGAESRVARDLSGKKANDFADAFEAQGVETPGSFVAADKAKSDAWRSASFADDAPMAAQLYRKAVGATRDDIERQIGAALGPDKAATLNRANKQYGVAADAMKLAENASTRDAAKKGFGMPEILAMTTGAGAAGGHALGHSAEGAIGGLGLALGAKAFDKYGHSSAARFSDFLAKRAAASSGGVAGNAVAEKLAPKLEDKLAPYLEALERDNERP